MKKKLTALLFALIFSVILIGCSSKTETTPTKPDTTTTPAESSHQHTFSQAWSSDSKKHYHLATCGHDVRSDEENHIYGDWIIITEATETTKGSKKQVCSVCGYENVVEISEISHTHTYSSSWSYDAIKHWHSSTCGHDVKNDERIHVYGDWITILEATETTKGSKKQVCSVCGYENIVEIPELTHTHTFSSNWSYDATKHWHISTCGHDVRQAEGEHTYGDWITITPATETTEGSKKQVCSACGYEKYDVIEIEGHTHSYSAVWSKNEKMHWHECSCGSKTAETEHQYGQWTTIVPATETSKGSMRRVCKICYYIEVIETDMLEHVHDYSSLVSDDYQHWYECRCGDRIKEEAHTYSDWLIETASTEDSTGTRIKVCSKCNYKYREQIAAHKHNYEDEICTICGYSDMFSYTLLTETTCKLDTYNGNKKVESLKIPQVINGYKIDEISEGILSGLVNLTKLTIPFVGGKLNATDDDTYHYLGYIFGEESYDDTYTTNIGSKNFYIPKKLTDIIVSDGNILEGAFFRCYKIRSVELPNSVTRIGDNAFLQCSSLVNIELPNSVISIGDSAFKWCTSLVSIELPNSVTSIGKDAFKCCYSLTSVTLENSATSIGDNAFERCTSLVSIELSNSVTSIGKQAFSECTRLVSIELPNSVISIGDSAFERCTSLVSIELLNSVTSIGQYAFEYCTSLTSVTLGNSVTSIGKQAFSECTRLVSIELPNSVTSIGKDAFKYCTSLTSVTLGNSVTSIGEDAFSNCYNLVEVINKSSLNVKKGSSSYGKVAYYALNVKTEGASDIINKDGYLFYTYEKINYLVAYKGDDTSLVLPNDYNGELYEIYQCVFFCYENLKSVTLGNSVTSIGQSAFEYCTSLTSVTLGNSVTSIGEHAFDSCKSLTSVIIGNSVTSIGQYAFKYCTRLISVIIGNKVTSIENDAFSYCNDLEKVYYMGTFEQWNAIGIGYNSLLIKSKRYYYKETQPTDDDNLYWHYDENGNPVAWKEI